MNQPSHAVPQVTTSEPNGAVEVITMLGDSVVDVQHLRPAGDKEKTKKRAAYTLFGIGALFLLMSLGAFSKGVSVASTNKADMQNWTQVKKKSARSFVSTDIGAAWDLMAFGGLGLGIFAMGWGLVRLRRTDAPSAFTVEGEGSPLISERAGELVVNVPTSMEAKLRDANGITSPAALAPSFVVPAQGSVKVANGPASFLIRAVPVPRKMPNLATRIDSRAATFLGASAVAHALLLLLMNTVQPEPKGAISDLGTQDVRMTVAETLPMEDDKPDPATDNGDDGDLDPDTGGTAGKPGEAGKAGDPKVASAKGSIKVKGDNQPTKLSRREAIDVAKTSGIVGVMKSTKVFSHIDGDAWLNAGMDDVNSYGPGNEEGDGGGTFGHHRHGFGPGGGGPDGIIGSGQYRITGPTGPGNVSTRGPGRPPGLDHKSRGPRIDLCKSGCQADGDLDPAIIRRYIQRKVRTIRNCYDRELLSRPNLSGTVVSRFIINSSGNVLGSTASGMSVSSLNSCVASVISTIKFPKTEDGGIVKVKYPFRFSSK